MGLNKAIEHGKSFRKAYRGAKAVDKSCRNHGSCPYCLKDRMHNNQRRAEAAKSRMKEWSKGERDE